MLAEEVHRLVEQYEDVSFYTLVVNKLILVCSLKRARRIVNCVYMPVSFVKSAVAAFRGLSPVVNFHLPNTSSIGFSKSQLRQPASLNTKTHNATYQFLVQGTDICKL